MPRDGARTFGDLIGRLDHLQIVCPKCDRLGRYLVHRHAMEHGPDVKVPDWIALMTRDCPRRQSPGLADACAAQCPGLLGLAIEDARQDPPESPYGSNGRCGPVQD
jgi:hypothetical protein